MGKADAVREEFSIYKEAYIDIVTPLLTLASS